MPDDQDKHKSKLTSSEPDHSRTQRSSFPNSCYGFHHETTRIQWTRHDLNNHYCTKAAIFLPCKETIDSEGVAQLYATHVFPHYSILQKIILDQDTRFTSNFSKELSQILGIKQNISTAYHPQTDGQSKHMNQSLEQYLQLFCTQDQKQWSQWLPLAQYMRNLWPSSTTKKSPFDLLMEYVPQAHQPSRKPMLPRIEDRLDKITELQSAAQAMHRDQD